MHSIHNLDLVFVLETWMIQKWCHVPPNPVDWSLIMSRVWVTEPGVVRGYIRFMATLFFLYLFYKWDTFLVVGF